MDLFKKLLTATTLTFILSAEALAYVATVEKTIALPDADNNHALLYNYGNLWVGSHEHDGEQGKISVYDSAGKLLQTLDVSQTIYKILPTGLPTVLLTGKTYSDELGYVTRITEAKLDAGEIKLQPHELDFVAQDILYDIVDRSLYVADYNESRIVKINYQGVSQLNAKINFPSLMEKQGSIFYAIEDYFFGHSEITNQLARLDLTTNTVTRLFTVNNPPGHIPAMVQMKGFGTLVLADQTKNVLYVFDFAKGKLNATMNTVPDPKAMTQLGRCLFVLSATKKKLAIYQSGYMPDETLTQIDEWDLANVSKDQIYFTDLSVDSRSGRIALRSGYNPLYPSAKVAVNILASKPDMLKACGFGIPSNFLVRGQ